MFWSNKWAAKGLFLKSFENKKTKKKHNLQKLILKMCVFEQTEVQQQWPAQQDLDYAAKPLRWIMFTEGVVPLVCFKEKKQTF